MKWLHDTLPIALSLSKGLMELTVPFCRQRALWARGASHLLAAGRALKRMFERCAIDSLESGCKHPGHVADVAAPSAWTTHLLTTSTAETNALIVIFLGKRRNVLVDALERLARLNYQAQRASFRHLHGRDLSSPFRLCKDATFEAPFVNALGLHARFRNKRVSFVQTEVLALVVDIFIKQASALFWRCLRSAREWCQQSRRSDQRSEHFQSECLHKKLPPWSHN